MRANGHSTRGDITSVKIAGDTKIAKFEVAISGQEQVPRFEITMDYPVIMRVLQCRTDLSSDFDDNGPIKPTLI